MLPGNSSMPVQQITVVPGRETASNGKSAPRSKDKNEVRHRLLNLFSSLSAARRLQTSVKLEMSGFTISYLWRQKSICP